MTDRVDGIFTRRGIRGHVTATGGEVHVSVEVPGSDAVPSHRPSTTATGLPTLKKLSKTENSEAVRQLVAARALLVGREAMAESPATEVVHVAARFDGSADVLRATLRRDRLEQAPWQLDAWRALVAVDPDVEVNVGGRTQGLRPL